jgi:hypothetical protein
MKAFKPPKGDKRKLKTHSSSTNTVLQRKNRPHDQENKVKRRRKGIN